MVTDSNYESNNFNYSESNEGNIQNGSSSLGAILQNIGSGSFVGSNKEKRKNSLIHKNPNNSE